MRIDHLNCIIEVANCKSISTAAKKLYISQTGLSAIIHSVEKELNIQMFYRTNKGTLLTPEGEQAIELMKDILVKNDELHYLSTSENYPHQIINLGIFPSGTYVLSSYLVKLWNERHRNAHLHIYEVSYKEVQTCINSHTANIVIGTECNSFFNQMYPSNNGQIFIEPLCHDTFCVLVSSESELAKKNHVHINEILQYHLLLTHSYPDPQDKPIGHILHLFKSFTVLNNVEVSKKILSENPDSVILTPSFSLYNDDFIANGKLKRLEVSGFETELTIFMMCNISSKLSIQETTLMQEIRDFFANFNPF